MVELHPPPLRKWFENVFIMKWRISHLCPFNCHYQCIDQAFRKLDMVIYIYAQQHEEPKKWPLQDLSKLYYLKLWCNFPCNLSGVHLSPYGYLHPHAVLQLVLPNSLSTTEVYGSMGLDLFDKRLYTLANYLDNHCNLRTHNPVLTWKDI